METDEMNSPKRVQKKSKTSLAFLIKETMVIVCLLIFGYALFSFYRAKAKSENALDRYISLGGYDLSYLQTYQYLLIFFWIFVGIAVIALFLHARELWEIRDLKKMLARNRIEKNKHG